MIKFDEGTSMGMRLRLVFLTIALVFTVAGESWTEPVSPKRLPSQQPLLQFLAHAPKHRATALRHAKIPRSNQAAAAVSGSEFLSASIVDAGGVTRYPVVKGDVNGDKKLDAIVVVQNSVSSTGSFLQVLLGHGDGTFTATTPIPVDFGTNHFVLVSDLNKDGKDDIVLVHPGSIDVLLSNGNGTFAAPLSTVTGINWPIAAAIWDVNRDKQPDIALVDGISSQAAFLPGNGNGTFQAAHSAAFPAQASAGVLADIDLDGNLDLVTNTAVYPGDGNGGFLTAVAFVSSDGENTGATSAASVAIADINGDGRPDVVTANGYWNTVSVFLNQGSRSFVQNGVSDWVGNDPVAVAIADLNWDGFPDLVVTNTAQSDLAVLIGKGNGTFLPVSAAYAVGGSASTAAVLADFDGDGNPDALVADNISGVVLASGGADGTFAAARDSALVVPPGSNALGGALSIASADFNGDGLPDIVVGQSAVSTGLGVVVFLTQSDGSLGPGTVYAADQALSFVATGDLNHDGKMDIVASDWSTGGLEVFLGRGDGTFQAPIDVAVPGYANGVVVADLNGDGWADVALAGIDPVAYVLLNDGAGHLNPAATYPLSGMANELTAADLNNDGKLDLCLPVTGSSEVAVLMGSGSGTFAAAPSFDTTLSAPYGVAVGDVNKDGKPDLVVTSLGDGELAVALGNGNGTFQAPTVYSASTRASEVSPFPAEVKLADVNGDGSLDIVYANSGPSAIGLLLGSGDGTFSGPREFPAGSDAFGLVTADLNNDGWTDVITANVSFTGVSVFRNASAVQSVSDFSIAVNPTTYQLASGGAGTGTVSITSINGFNESIQLSCQSLPAALSCTFTPSVIHPPKGATVTSQLSIGASGSAIASSRFGTSALAATFLAPLVAGLFFFRKPKIARKQMLLAALAGLLLLSGCGSLGSGSPKQPKTYTVSVAAVSAKGTTHSVQVQVTVQQ